MMNTLIWQVLGFSVMFVIMVDLPVPRYALNSLNWQKKAQSPTGTKNISQVGAPGPATL